MRKTHLSWCVAVACLSLGSVAHADSELVAKQLAGPPEEFAAMAAPLPAAAAIQSNSALLAVELDATTGRWEMPLAARAGQARFVVFADPASNWDLQLTSPGGATEKASGLAKSVSSGEFGIAEARYPGQQYQFDGLADGEWTVALSGTPGARGYVLVEGDGITEMSSWVEGAAVVDGRVGITAQLARVEDDGVALAKAAGRVAQASLRLTAPDGSVQYLAMRDDGASADGLAGDGVYGAWFTPDQAGSWIAQAQVDGEAIDGAPVLRTAEHIVPVVVDTLDLATDAKAASRVAGDGRIAIRLPVVAKKAGQHYRVHAEVWGTSARGKAAGVAWVGGMVTPADGALELGLDEGWLARSGLEGPYELRNVRIEDPDHFVSVAEAKRLPLTLPALDLPRMAKTDAITDRMRVGPRPADLAKGVGRRLLLVHGYCSGGVWPAGQFSEASTFLDANQNRSHDQFARLIQSFGSTWNSFGTVAHSQGGMASLHLYTYYWSGLDNATGNRLIQSVGTPYRGTNLAGILASLGSWFGVGCGSNDNLQYSGAQAWLAGIPTWARAKVNYYTTAFRTTNWWTNDYCNFATDLVLSDPEDGTTEQVNGQLSGGVNRGHVSGQCHTAGMRDPAQYSDATRNATMNTNAAR